MIKTHKHIIVKMDGKEYTKLRGIVKILEYLNIQHVLLAVELFQVR